DYLTLKYNSTGSLQYEVRDDGPGFGNDEPTAIIVDEAGNNVYVTGLTTGGTLGADYYTVKYDAELNPLWGETYNGPGDGDDVPSAIAVDSLGYVYVTGKSLLRVVNGDDNFDFATVRYDTDGNPEWNTSGDGAVRFDGGGGNDEAIAIAVDGTDIYVAGFITTSTTEEDYFVINYDDNGSIIWIARYPLPDDSPPGHEIATAMTMDATAIYVTGYSIQNGISRYATVKFNK
ncbi:MAG: SBBP repeat-containing protein, partial [Desulfobacteraceae bacterium]|nr:SBBP repeat-containing protein [Desulfobacteraceae bacterium]